DAGRIAAIELLGRRALRGRLERRVRDAAAAADRRDLLDRRVAAELPEQRRAAERSGRAHDGDGCELGDAEREDATARHRPVITPTVLAGREQRLIRD